MHVELEPSKLAKFLRRVEDGYNDTPYHSKTHAADVLQSMHTLLTLGGLASRMGDELIMLAGQLLSLSHEGGGAGGKKLGGSYRDGWQGGGEGVGLLAAWGTSSSRLPVSFCLFPIGLVLTPRQLLHALHAAHSSHSCFLTLFALHFACPHPPSLSCTHIPHIHTHDMHPPPPPPPHTHTPDQHHPLCPCAGYLSAICHDLDHKGLNNDFLIKTNSSLAIQYNDLSPLENHHLAQTFRLLHRDDCGLLRHLSKDRQVSSAVQQLQYVSGWGRIRGAGVGGRGWKERDSLLKRHDCAFLSPLAGQ